MTIYTLIFKESKITLYLPKKPVIYPQVLRRSRETGGIDQGKNSSEFSHIKVAARLTTLGHTD